jgi:hypothetical protein
VLTLPRNVIVTSRYRQDRNDFGKFMRSPRIKGVANQAAADIAADAQKIATAEAYHTGEYSRSFKVNRRARMMKVAGALRATSAVYNNNRNAPGQEFGDRWHRGKGKRIMRRAGAPYHSRKPL